jgi:hypothetical protein
VVRSETSEGSDPDPRRGRERKLQYQPGQALALPPISPPGTYCAVEWPNQTGEREPRDESAPGAGGRARHHRGPHRRGLRIHSWREGADPSARGRSALTYAATDSDRCLIDRSAGTGRLQFFTRGLELDPAGPYITFSVLGYHGPGTYPAHISDSPHPYGSGWFAWSLSQWNAYFYTVTVTISSEESGQASGSVNGTLYATPQLGAHPLAARLTGEWRCMIGDTASPAIAGEPAPSVAVRGRAVSFMAPQAWSWQVDSSFEFTAGTPRAFLSPQPLLQPCFTAPGTVQCHTPLPALRPDSMLLEWSQGFLPGSQPRLPSAGALPFDTAGGAGWIRSDADACVTALGGEQLAVTVPDAQLSITACLRGPHLARLERLAKAIMATTTWSR